MAEQSARNSRARILRFGDEILHGTKHTQEHFDEILGCITEYTKYCDEHPDFMNHVTVKTTQHILDVYVAAVQLLSQKISRQTEHITQAVIMLMDTAA